VFPPVPRPSLGHAPPVCPSPQRGMQGYFTSPSIFSDPFGLRRQPGGRWSAFHLPSAGGIPCSSFFEDDTETSSPLAGANGLFFFLVLTALFFSFSDTVVCFWLTLATSAPGIRHAAGVSAV